MSIRRGILGSGQTLSNVTLTGTVNITNSTFSPTVWDDINVAGTQLATGATAPSLGNYGTAAIQMPLFQASAVNDQAFLTVQLPHSYKIGTAIYPHIHWCPDTTATGAVVWQYIYTWQDIYGPTNAVTTVNITNHITTNQQWVTQIAAFPAVTQTNMGISSQFSAQVNRQATSTADTYPGNAVFLSFDIHHEKDSIGSKYEFVK